jgi:ABC-type transporter Mla subunit MlaD
MTDDLARRLAAVERAVTGGETDLSEVADAADVTARLDAVEERLDTIETRLDDLDGTTQALRGYLGSVDGVAEDVERRADLALSKAEAVEEAVFTDDGGLAVERLPTAPPESAADGGRCVDAAGSTLSTTPGDAPDATPSASHARGAGSTPSRPPFESRPTSTGRDGSAPSPSHTGAAGSRDRSVLARLRDVL